MISKLKIIYKEKNGVKFQEKRADEGDINEIKSALKIGTHKRGNKMGAGEETGRNIRHGQEQAGKQQVHAGAGWNTG